MLGGKSPCFTNLYVVNISAKIFQWSNHYRTCRGETVSAPKQDNYRRRVAGENVWLGRALSEAAPSAQARPIEYEVLPTEEAVGAAQWEEIERAAREKEGDLVIILLGGRGAQAMYKQVARIARTDEADEL